MANLADRIKSLRLSANMTQEEFGKKFGIVKSTVSLYESGKSTPNDEIKKQICDYFHISLDYLLGINRFEELNSNLQIDESEFALNFKMKIRNLIADLKMSEDEFVKQTGFHIEEKDSYLYDNKIPSIKDLIKIAKTLNVSTDYLLGQSPEITNIEKKMLNTFVKLNEDNQDIIIGKSKELLKEQYYEDSVAADKSLKKTGTDNLGK